MAEHPDKSLLQHVVGIVMHHHHPADMPVERPAVAFHQQPEAAAYVFPHCLDDCPVVGHIFLIHYYCFFVLQPYFFRIVINKTRQKQKSKIKAAFFPFNFHEKTIDVFDFAISGEDTTLISVLRQRGIYQRRRSLETRHLGFHQEIVKHIH